MPSSQRCEKCYNWTNALEPRGADLLCGKCRKAKFYVLAVEPGEEARVLTRLRKDLRLKGFAPLFGKLLVPRDYVAKVSKDKYSVWSGKARVMTTPVWDTGHPNQPPVEAWVYHDNAADALWEAKKKFGDDYDVTHVELEKAGGVKRVQKAVSFRGYVIVQCDLTFDVLELVTKTRGVWGVLPMKPTLSGVRYAKGEPPTKTKAKKWEKEKYEEWTPTPLDSEDAAMLLIQAEGAKAKPAGLNPVYKPGDKVKVVGGQYRGTGGTVLEAVGNEVKVEFVILGRRAGVVLPADVLTRGD